MQVPEEKERLKQTDILIIGGGAVDEALETEINHLPTAVYSTYGMTETLSHIALRRLNGASASEHYYPFPSVKLSLSAENTLIIDAPLVCDETLQTNDIARIYPDGSFMILGRKDNVINSGGIKIQAEEMEKLLRPFIPVSFVITSVPDQRLGQAVTLLLADQPDTEEIGNKLHEILEPYYRPKHILTIESIPQTENGKINRAECRGVLSLRQTIDLIVEKNDIQIDITTDSVDKMITADSQAVAITRNQPYAQVRASRLYAGSDSRSTTMDRMEAIRIHIIR